MARKKGTNINIGNIIVVLLLVVGVGAIGYLYQQHMESMGLHVGNSGQEYAENVIYINSEEELVAFSENVNAGEPYTGKHVILQNDLDMSLVGDFRPIGIWEGGNYFYGIFDGNGHTISNLNIVTEEGLSNSGLFGSLGGTICNLIIEDSYVKGAACGAFCSIALSNTAQIYNCIARNIVIEAQYTGIIGGQYIGSLENCVIDGYTSGEVYDISKSDINNVDVNLYNNNLENLSAKCHNVPMCKWTENKDLNPQEKVQASDMYIHIDSHAYNGNIYPFYKEGIYYFIMPSNELQGKIVLHVPEDEKETYVINAPGNGIYEQDVLLEDAPYSVKLCYTENTPAVFLNCNEAWDMDYLKALKTNVSYGGYLQVLDEHGMADFKGGLERVQGRGNDSWLMPKKGFSLNLIEDGDILGMGADKDYALLSGYRDSSLLTYKVVQDLSREMQLDYAPEYHLVNFYANGEYQGLYVLTEKMNVGYHRVNIDSSYKDVTGGYLYELDDLDCEGEVNLVNTEHGHTYLIKDPLIVKQPQLEYSITLWNLYEKAVYSPTGYNEYGGYYGDYMDIDSLAKLWLFLEINGEYSVSSSIYFYKDSDSSGDGKIHALYPWDVEHSMAEETFITEDVMENINSNGAKGLWSVVYQHQDMKETVYKNWMETFRPALCKLLDENTGYHEDELSYIEAYGERYAVASKWNELVWGEEHNIANKSAFIKHYLEGRIPYLDESLKLIEN